MPSRQTLVIVAVTLLLAACGTAPEASPTRTPAPSATSAVPSSPGPASASPTGEGSCSYVRTGTAAKPAEPPGTGAVATSGTVTYVLKMTNGDVRLRLDRTRAPCTVHSFESLAAQGFFDRTTCHRLSDSGIFILQCGDPTGTGSGGPGYQFPDETDGTESYTSGVVAMANAGPNTNGSQFFLVWDDSTSLDRTPNYTVFGRMDAASRDVVASMAAEGQDGRFGGNGGRPNNPSEIVSVRPG